MLISMEKSKRSNQRPKFTVCTNCKMLLKGEHIWDSPCKAKPLKKKRDPYDGQEKYFIINLLGGTNFTDQEFADCRTINTNGQCKFFERK